jgi:hypothetical protein
MAALQNGMLRLCRFQFAREQFERDIPMVFGGCVVDSAGEFNENGASHSANHTPLIVMRQCEN